MVVQVHAHGRKGGHGQAAGCNGGWTQSLSACASDRVQNIWFSQQHQYKACVCSCTMYHAHLLLEASCMALGDGTP